jgi:hypothetical protein
MRYAVEKRIDQGAGAEPPPLPCYGFAHRSVACPRPGLLFMYQGREEKLSGVDEMPE